MRLDLLQEAILILQIGLDFCWVFKNKGDDAINLGQRPERWLGLEDRLRRAPAPKIVHYNIQPNTRASYVVAAIPDLDVFVGRHHQLRPLL